MLRRFFRRLVGATSPSPSPSEQEGPDVPSADTISQGSPSMNRHADEPASSSEKPWDLVLYGRSSCPYCARVDRVIKELGVEDKITRRHTGYGSEWRSDLQSRTGSTQVPCLFIDGVPMFESLDIIDWMRKNLS